MMKYEYFDTTDYGVYPFLFPTNATAKPDDPELAARDCDKHGFVCGIAPFDPRNSWNVYYHMKNACSCSPKKRCLRYYKNYYLSYWQYRCMVPDTYPLYQQ